MNTQEQEIYDSIRREKLRGATQLWLKSKGFKDASAHIYGDDTVMNVSLCPWDRRVNDAEAKRWNALFSSDGLKLIKAKLFGEDLGELVLKARLLK